MDTNACPACAALLDDAAPLRSPDRHHGVPGVFEVHRCARCGSGLTLPLLAGDELGRLYPPGYGPTDEPRGLQAAISRAIRARQTRRALRTPPLRALATRRAGRVLEVGSGRGDIAVELVSRGWQVTAIEPDPCACEAMRARGVDARPGTLADHELAPGGYDVAVFRHALEHVGDPLADLQRVVRALAPGGIVAITVPNFGGRQARRFGGRWYHLDLPRHRSHFTAEGLAALLRRAGLELTELRASTSTVGLPASAQYALAGRCLFPRGLGLRVASGLCVLMLPLARAYDRGSGDELNALALRHAG